MRFTRVGLAASAALAVVAVGCMPPLGGGGSPGRGGSGGGLPVGEQLMDSDRFWVASEGQRFDLASYTEPGQLTVFEFMAEW